MDGLLRRLLFPLAFCLVIVKAQNATVSNATTAASAASAATNASLALQGQCLKISTANQTVQTNGYFVNGSCFVATYMANIPYPNITASCTKIMKSSNSTATCQMLQTTNTSRINALIDNQLIEANDNFLIGLSRKGCNGTWHWDNANGSMTTVDVNSTLFRGLPDANQRCGLDNVMYSMVANQGVLGGSAPNATGNVLVCECRTDYPASGVEGRQLLHILPFSLFMMAVFVRDH